MIERDSPYGFDVYVGPQADGTYDMDRVGSVCSGLTLVRNAIAARCISGPLVMTGAQAGIVEFGEDVRGWVGAAGSLAGKEARLAVLIGNDDRIDRGSVTVTSTRLPAGATYSIILSVSARALGQPVAVRLGITGLTVEMLASG